MFVIPALAGILQKHIFRVAGKTLIQPSSARLLKRLDSSFHGNDAAYCE
jgi:hypothetical protein